MSNSESEEGSDVIKNNAAFEKASECQKSVKILSAVTTAKNVVSDEVRWNFFSRFTILYSTAQR